MVLNPDCVRDIMFVLEASTAVRYDMERNGSDRYSFVRIDCRSLHNSKVLNKKYSIEEIAYTLIQLAEGDYISMEFSCDNAHTLLFMGNILYVTPKGHDLLAKIQNEAKWTQKLKPALKAFGHVSLAIIEAVASGVTDAAIKGLTSNPLQGKP